jgi:hypothetical protein
VPTLNRTKEETLKILKWGSIAVGIIILFFIAIKTLTFVANLITPPSPPAAAFGKLPEIPFPEQTRENLSYSLDTLTGFLPIFPDRAKVCKITTEAPTLLGLDKTQEKVFKIGFESSGTQIAEDIYQWVDQNKNLQRKITINIFSSDFNLSSSYLLAQSLQPLSGQEEKTDTIKVAKAFLSDMSLLPKDLDDKKTKITLYSIEKSMLIPTSKISDAKIAKVDFFQKDINDLPIYYDEGISSTISFSIGKENKVSKVLEARFFHKNISEENTTYAIKTASEAFAELQGGKAYVAYKPADVVEFTIKKIFLGYYLGENEQEYLMPVVVFEGSNDFVAYVSAIKDEWVRN